MMKKINEELGKETDEKNKIKQNFKIAWFWIPISLNYTHNLKLWWVLHIGFG